LFRLHISEMIMAIILFFYEMQFEKQTCNTFTTFKLVGKCQLLLIFLPNINSHLGVKDSDLGIKHPYTFFPQNMSSFAKTVEVLINSKHEQLP